MTRVESESLMTAALNALSNEIRSLQMQIEAHKKYTLQALQALDFYQNKRLTKLEASLRKKRKER